MSDHKVRVGIIGLGAMGSKLMQGFVRNEATEVVAVSDVAPGRAQEVAAELGTGVQAYTDHRELLQQDGLDLVYIAAPPKFHHRITLDAVAANKHILSEKPLANSVEEAKEMWEAVERAGLVNAINFPLNYSFAFNQYVKLFRDGFIGDLRRIELHTFFPQWPRAWQQNDWVAKREQGGFVLEVGVHYINAVQRLGGTPEVVFNEITFPEDPTLCETGYFARMQLADGTPVYFNGMSNVPGGEEVERISFTAYGTQGALSLENWGTLKAAKLGEPMSAVPQADNPANIIDNVVRAIRGEEALLISFKDGYEAQVVLECLRNPQA
ncbi:MAG TPA: Gfo/Idh/MocA family oxidoreductase [Bacilli bacterium]|nr:Gfo/Idh/MocA family oxidoreductase [Bacilli bacterium]